MLAGLFRPLRAVVAIAKDPVAYDAVFMDIMMSVMDGLEAAGIICGKIGCKVSIFAITANVLSEDAERSRMAGMEEHLTKPLQERDIVCALKRRIVR